MQEGVGEVPVPTHPTAQARTPAGLAGRPLSPPRGESFFFLLNQTVRKVCLSALRADCGGLPPFLDREPPAGSEWWLSWAA